MGALICKDRGVLRDFNKSVYRIQPEQLWVLWRCVISLSNRFKILSVFKFESVCLSSPLWALRQKSHLYGLYTEAIEEH